MHHDKIRTYAKTTGMTQGEVIEVILDGYFSDAPAADNMKDIVGLAIKFGG